MKKKTVPAVQPIAAAYTPKAGDFDFLRQQDIHTDTNYSSQGYWKGVFVHFVKDKRAMIGVVIVAVILVLALVGPLCSGYEYDQIIKAPNDKGRMKAVTGVEPRIPFLHELFTGAPYNDNY